MDRQNFLWTKFSRLNMHVSVVENQSWDDAYLQLVMNNTNAVA